VFEQACLYMNMMDNEPALFVVYQPSLLRADLQRISRIVSLLVPGSHARQVHTPSEAPAVLERPLQECYDPRCSKDPEYDPMLLNGYVAQDRLYSTILHIVGASHCFHSVSLPRS